MSNRIYEILFIADPNLGETEMDESVPTYVPPQLPRYHFHDAPVPNEPPCFDSCDDAPGQIELGLADAPAGAVESVLTVSVA